METSLDRRAFLKSVAAFAAVPVLGLTQASARKPNIVFIMADDLGWQELGCYGQKRIRTPHLDRMAVEGMRFTRYYAGSAVCAPSRCNLLTGKHGGHAFVRDNHEIANPDRRIFGGQLPIPADEITVAEMLKTCGYTAGCFGKWGLGAPGSSGDPLSQGFDRFYGYNCQRHAHNLYPSYLVRDRERDVLDGNSDGLTGEQYAPERIGEEMFQFIRRNRNRPFFVYFASVTPHLALQVPEKDLAEYAGLWKEEPYAGTSYLPHPTPKACYAAMIGFLDRQVGKLFALLRELGLDKNTIVFFTSDNGTTTLKEQVDADFFESVGPLRGLKGSLYEGGIRVPMIARWPGRIPAATVSDHTAAHYDIMATLAEIAGGPVPPGTDGIGFLPSLLGQSNRQQTHEYLFWDFSGYGGQLAARLGRWKGIKKDLRKNPDAALELYDLESDIGEKNDVARLHTDTSARMEAVMREGRTMPPFEGFRFGRYGG